MGMPEMSASLAALSPLKLALLAQQERARSEAVLRADPIAVVGMGCRLPGGVQSPEDFWRLLRDGVDAVREVPAGRWDVDAVYDPDPAAPGKAMCKWGGYLDDIDRFDAAFFGILPREAERMDPQQRLFLEVACEALDHAGLPRERLAGSRTGVFVASYYNDYAQLEYNDLRAIDARTLTGTVHSVLVNRLSYLLDLRGPSMSIDTACSSSLVAIHLACQSLRHGESDIALAGGVSLMVTEGQMIALSKVGFMAPDGRCKTFDARANGFGRGEGCSVIVLKRLGDAVADGDRVLALVRGSAVNQDGHSTVLAAPNGLAQQALIREALANAQLAPSRIGYVEAHGTGTQLGDPIEVEALAATVGQPATGAGPCLIGAAKANIGHLEAAAGATGVVKSVLVLQKGEIPAQVHFQSLNPHILLAGTRLSVPTALTPWPAGVEPRCIGTSGFGVGGTNAHIILQEAPRLPAAPGNDVVPPPWLLPLSAQSPEALQALARRWIDFLPHADAPLPALCAMAGERRTHFDYRLGVVASSVGEMRTKLQAYIDGKAPAGFACGHRRVSAPPRLGFVFSGQGQQWLGMGRELMLAEPVVREVLNDIDTRLRAHVSWSLLDELAAAEGRSRLDATEVAQPAIFALQVALTALWASWGVRPDAVVGHSVGELAALHVAGVLSLDEALRIVVLRARAMQHATGQGAMAAVGLSEAEAQLRLQGLGGRVSIGAVNSSRSVVLSGEAEALAGVLKTLERDGISQRTLPVNYAFHSVQMQSYAQAFAAELGTVQVSLAQLPVYSTVKGRALRDTVVDAAYMACNVRETVRFAAAVEAMLGDGCTAFLEIGAHPVLAVSLAECCAGHDEVVPPLASLSRGRPEREMLLLACAGLYAAGRAPDWVGLQRARAEVVDLPAYPWQRERYWIRKPPPAAPSMALVVAGDDGLLGRRVPVAHATVFESSWPGSAPAWLEDHRIGGRLLMPGMGMAEALRSAATHALGRGDIELLDLVLERPLVIDEAEGATTTWQVIVESKEGGVCLGMHRATTLEEGVPLRWERIATAQARSIADESSEAVTATPESGFDSKAFYDAFAAIGSNFGPSFRTVTGLKLGADTGVVTLRRPDAHCGANRVHPGLLDGALQACVAAAGTDGLPRSSLLPIAVERYELRAPVPERVFASLRWSRGQSGDTLRADIDLRAENGMFVARLHGVRFVAAPEAKTDRDDWLHEVAWMAAAPAADARASGAWLLLSDEGGVGDALAAHLQAQGQPCLRVRTGKALRRMGLDCSEADPACPEHLSELLKDDGWRVGQPLAGVVHLSSLDIPMDEPAADIAARRAQDDDAKSVISGLIAAQALARRVPGNAAQLVFVTAGAQSVGSAVPRVAAAGLWGLASAVAVEHPELAVRAIDLDADAAAPDVAGLAAELRLGRAGPARVALRGATRWQPRLQHRAASIDVRPSRLALGDNATLDGLHWQTFEPAAPAEGEVRVRVVAVGVNFRDVLLALGMIPREAAFFGAECAGVIEAVGAGVQDLRVGDHVFGFAPHSLATHVGVPAAWLAPWPAGLGSMERAASLPVAFLTAMLGLQRLAGLKAGQRVLIHAAAGGVGMAAVQLAMRAGAEVYATAGSPTKRERLHALGVVHVFDSRSTEFAAQVLAATHGAGVDVVLNSLAGDFIGASVEALAAEGCFLELGKRDLWSVDRFHAVRPKARYQVYDLGRSAMADPTLVRPMLDALVAGLKSGSLVAPPLRVFGFDDVAEAFRHMAQARHVGKLVLRAPVLVDSAPLVRGDASYWITGGLGALGLHTARWLASRGARHLVLTSRTAPDATAQTVLDGLHAAGVQVCLHKADVADGVAMRAQADAFGRTLPLLRGVVHAAGVLDDGVLLHQDAERFSRVLSGKAHGARVLDALTRELPLDFFVLYSAVGLLLGPAGQGAYAAANAELDALAYARRAAGRPALSVAWGLWRDGGMGARLAASGHDAWSARGMGWIGADAAFARLEGLLREGVTHAAVAPIDWRRFLAHLPEGSDAAFFERLAARMPIRSATAAVPMPAGRVPQWRLLPEAQRREAVQTHVMEQALQVLGLPPTTALEPRLPLKEAGLDSLMAVELRNALARSIGQSLPATLLFDHPSLDALTNFLVAHLGLQEMPEAIADSTNVRDLRMDYEARAAVAALSDDEAEAALLAELEAAAPRSRP